MELNYRTFKDFMAFNWLAVWELMIRKYLMGSDPVKMRQVSKILFGETGILENYTGHIYHQL